MASTLQRLIIVLVEQSETGEVRGVEQLALQLGCADHYWLRTLLRRCEANGELEIVHSNGGRGRKSVFKRNRNSGGGSPRKVRV